MISKPIFSNDVGASELKSNFDPVFFPDSTSDAWTSNIDDLDGARYLQTRITFIANAVGVLVTGS